MYRMPLPTTRVEWDAKVSKLDELVSRSEVLIDSFSTYPKIADWLSDTADEAKAIADRMRNCPRRPQE